MDDLKQMGKCEEELKKEIKILKTNSRDIKIAFGLETCVGVCSESGNYHRQHTVNTMENEIKELGPMTAYKYLGVESSHNMEHKNDRQVEEELCKKIKTNFEHRAEHKNRLQALGTLRCSFGINCYQERIQKLDRKQGKP
jgi:ribosomal protein L32